MPAGAPRRSRQAGAALAADLRRDLSGRGCSGRRVHRGKPALLIPAPCAALADAPIADALVTPRCARQDAMLLHLVAFASLPACLTLTGMDGLIMWRPGGRACLIGGLALAAKGLARTPPSQNG